VRHYFKSEVSFIDIQGLRGGGEDVDVGLLGSNIGSVGAYNTHRSLIVV
jgi:hypothetical protein